MPGDMLEQGFSYDQLSDLVLDGLATLEPSITREGGVVWAAITAAGRKAIAELSSATCALVQRGITDCFHSNAGDRRRGDGR